MTHVGGVIGRMLWAGQGVRGVRWCAREPREAGSRSRPLVPVSAGLLLAVFLIAPLSASLIRPGTVSGDPGPIFAQTIAVGPSDCSASAVNGAISTANDGDVVDLTCTGSVTWAETVTIPNTKGITLRGRGNNTPKSSASFPLTVVSGADPILYIDCDDNNSLSRVTGFKFRNTIASVSGAINIRGRGVGTDGLGCFRIDNNYFDSIQLPHADMEGTITVGGRGSGSYTSGVLRGLIDDNTFHDCSYYDGYVISINEPWRDGFTDIPHAGQNAWERPFAFGDKDFTFVEDNLFENINQAARHQIEAIQGGKYVVRYNTFHVDLSPSAYGEVIEAHGWCFCSTIGHGTRGGEIYNNAINGAQIGHPILLRGGRWLAYDNTFGNAPADTFIFLREYRAGSPGMYSQCDNTCSTDPNWHNGVTDGSYYPLSEQISGSYFWNNRYQGVNQDPVVDTAGVQPLYIQPGRDYFVSPGKPAALASYAPHPYPHPLRGGAPAPTNDTTPPDVSLTAPTGGATVSGALTVSAMASDDVAVAGVRFRVDGVNLGAEDTSPPYEISWNTILVPNGLHALAAVARDASENTATSSPILVTVSNTRSWWPETLFGIKTTYLIIGATVGFVMILVLAMVRPRRRRQ